MGKNYLCIDIGGTKTAVACYNFKGRELFYKIFPTEAEKGINDLICRIDNYTKDFLRNNKVSGGVIASPGPLDCKNGKIINIVTMGWKDIPVISLFEKKFGVPFKLINDCNAGALGEWAYGAAKGKDNICYISVSTGVGGGIIINGKLYEGSGNSAEFGHIQVCGDGRKCGCGNTDCLELYSSGTAIEKEYYRRSGKILSAKEIAELARKNDTNALYVYSQCSKMICFAVGNIIKVLDPEAIVFGGGVCHNADLFLPSVQSAFPDTNITVSDLEGKQVLLGAYVHAKRMKFA